MKRTEAERLIDEATDYICTYYLLVEEGNLILDEEGDIKDAEEILWILLEEGKTKEEAVKRVQHIAFMCERREDWATD